MIGHPVAHSLSPAIFEAAFDATGLDWTYVAFDIAEPSLPTAFAGMVAIGMAGVNVTMPHKTAVAALVDQLTPAAEELGAVNCISITGGSTIGTNTDGEGFVAGLTREDVEVAGLRVGVIGAGGAARAIVRAVVQAGATEAVVVNRSRDRALDAARLGGPAGRVGEEAELAECALVVNATPVGMGGTGAVAMDVSLLRPNQVVVDTVYHPLETPLLAAARERGARALHGLGMLVGQAACAFEWWTGLPAPVEEMTRAATAALSP